MGYRRLAAARATNEANTTTNVSCMVDLNYDKAQ